MKTRLISIIATAFLLSGMLTVQTGCTTPPVERVVQVKTLKAIGETVSTAMESAAKMRLQGQITSAQWEQIADMHDNRFLPAYRLAIRTVKADLSSVASPDILAISTDLINAVAAYQK